MVYLIDGNNLLYRELSNENTVGGQHSIRMLYTNLALSSDFTIFVWDGYNSRKKRLEIYPEYKGNRPEKGEDIYAMFKLFEELLDNTSITQVKVPEWEADDVIYTLANYFVSEGEKVVINTNDADYLQIKDVELPMVTKWHWPRHRIIAYKALQGDRTDNIGGMPGFGEGSWNNCQNHHEEIDRCLRENDWEAWQKIPFPNRNVKACLDKGNFDHCVMFYKIITMMEVPAEEIQKFTKTGVPHQGAAESLLGKYHL